MNVIFDTVERIDQAVFDRLFKESLRGFEGGSYPSARNLDDAKKRIESSFKKCLAQKNGVLWQTSVDNHPCVLTASYITGDSLKWDTSLVGDAKDGSRSFIYSDEATRAKDEYLRKLKIAREYSYVATNAGPYHFFLNKAKNGIFRRATWIKEKGGTTVFLIGDPVPGDTGFSLIHPGDKNARN